MRGLARQRDSDQRGLGSADVPWVHAADGPLEFNGDGATLRAAKIDGMAHLRQALRQLALFAVLAVGGSQPGSALADDAVAPPAAPVPATTAAEPAQPVPAPSAADRKRATEQELEAVARDIKLSDDRQAEIAREIAALDKDRARISEQLVAAGGRERALRSQVEEAEARIGAIEAEADGLRRSLASRRAVLADVLAALQRIGRKPPPALVVRPEDALASIRSAILIGAVLPELRGEAERLAGDLARLVALKDQSNTERDQFHKDATALKDETTRLEQLMSERRNSMGDQAKQLEEEKRRTLLLADKAGTLKDLIAHIGTDAETTARAADQAQKPGTGEQVAKLEPAPDHNTVTPKGIDAAPLQPAIRFAEAKGKLTLPAPGKIVKSFGEDDGLGSPLKGIRIATRPEARVASPCDGSVAYAGPFRSYGKLLIIYGGDGYHVLLSGLDRIDVEHGQFVLAGEPVGVMGARRTAGATTDGAADMPLLFVEFRKDNASIDPAPWWVQTRDEKVRG